MQITEIKIRPRGTQVERIIAVCSSVPAGEVINKHELIEAANITPGCYLQICNSPKLEPYKFKRFGVGGNLWGQPRTIAKLHKLQEKL